MLSVQLPRRLLAHVLRGHPWIYADAIERPAGARAGDIARVTCGGKRVALALYDDDSPIALRVLTTSKQDRVGPPLWRRRVDEALALRRAAIDFERTDAFRLINGEGDGLPGLIVDKYGDFLVMQSLTAGIETQKDLLLGLLNQIWQPKGIVERSDADVRAKENLPIINRVASGDAPPETLIIQENGIQFGVNLLGGHKSGFYLDQRENRTAVTHPHHIANKTMLNVFAYTGGFGLYGIANGASQVTHVDSSYDALVLAEQNVERNGWKRPQDEYIAGDAFDVLRHYRDTDQTFDVIVLDPPKFAHSQRDIERATRGYKDLNWLALRLLPPGGLLVTFSCSGLISAKL